MDDALAYLRDLRERCLHNPSALEIIEHCLEILARAAEATPAERKELEAAVETLRADLERRFGPPRPIRVH